MGHFETKKFTLSERKLTAQVHPTLGVLREKSPHLKVREARNADTPKEHCVLTRSFRRELGECRGKFSQADFRWYSKSFASLRSNVCGRHWYFPTCQRREVSHSKGKRSGKDHNQKTTHRFFLATQAAVLVVIRLSDTKYIFSHPILEEQRLHLLGKHRYIVCMCRKNHASPLH